MTAKRLWRTPHIRRLDQMHQGGRWRIHCDCGWQGWVSAFSNSGLRSRDEIETLLDDEFKRHLPAHERSLYLLVDQRQVAVPRDPTDPDSPLELVARGNFVMPEGRPCQLLRHFKRGGVQWGVYLEGSAGQSAELPIGEIRTADNRVLRLDAPA